MGWRQRDVKRTETACRRVVRTAQRTAAVSKEMMTKNKRSVTAYRIKPSSARRPGSRRSDWCSIGGSHQGQLPCCSTAAGGQATSTGRTHDCTTCFGLSVSFPLDTSGPSTHGYGDTAFRTIGELYDIIERGMEALRARSSAIRRPSGTGHRGFSRHRQGRRRRIRASGDSPGDASGRRK